LLPAAELELKVSTISFQPTVIRGARVASSVTAAGVDVGVSSSVAAQPARVKAKTLRPATAADPRKFFILSPSMLNVTLDLTPDDSFSNSMG
jgi:hypothetical protein